MKRRAETPHSTCSRPPHVDGDNLQLSLPRRERSAGSSRSDTRFALVDMCIAVVGAAWPGHPAKCIAVLES
jgi:hypothetical protein